MRRTIILTLMLVAATALRGQTVDTAARIVDRYLELMGNDRWPADSLLVMETKITTTGLADTIVMRRWYAPPQMVRVEVWNGKKMETAMCSNGKDRYRRYNPSLGYWVDVTSLLFFNLFSGYDFRGPLYNWRVQGGELTYKGPASVMGMEGLQAVQVAMPDMYTRYYFFEPTGLLSLIVETAELDSTYADVAGSHIEWKFIHEYQRVCNSLIPKQESFMREGRLTVLETTAHMERLDTLVFNKD